MELKFTNRKKQQPSSITSSIPSKSIHSAVLTQRSTSLLSFYTVPPNDEINLIEFEQCSFDRLQLLKNIETLRTRRGLINSTNSISSVEMNESIGNLLKKYNLNHLFRDNLS